MIDERRQSNIELVLVELGEIKQISKNNQMIISELSERVGTQNGRILIVEKWIARMQGAVLILALLVVPLAIRFLGSWFDQLIQK